MSSVHKCIAICACVFDVRHRRVELYGYRKYLVGRLIAYKCISRYRRRCLLGTFRVRGQCWHIESDDETNKIYRGWRKTRELGYDLRSDFILIEFRFGEFVGN